MCRLILVVSGGEIDFGGGWQYGKLEVSQHSLILRAEKKPVGVSALHINLGMSH